MYSTVSSMCVCHLWIKQSTESSVIARKDGVQDFIWAQRNITFVSMSTCSSDDKQSDTWVGEVKSDEMKKKKWKIIIHTLGMGMTWTWSHWSKQTERERERYWEGGLGWGINRKEKSRKATGGKNSERSLPGRNQQHQYSNYPMCGMKQGARRRQKGEL